jgi:hypothetical protein
MSTLQQLAADTLHGPLANTLGTLTSPLAALKANPPAPLDLGKDWHADARNGDWGGQVAIDGAVSLACSLDPGSLGSGTQAAAGNALLALELDARLGVDLGGQFRAGAFGVRAAGGATGSSRLRWIFEHPATRPLGPCLLDDLRFLADPLSLDALRALQADPDWRGVRVEIDGTLSASLSLTAGLQATGAVLTVAGGHQAPVGVTFGLNGSASLRRAGTFVLVAMPQGDDLHVRLTRADDSTANFGLRLDASADLGVVLSDVAGVLASTLPDPQAWKGDLLPLLEPAAYLDALLGKLVDAEVPDPTFNLLAKLSLGLGSGPAADATLVQQLADILRSHLQAVGDLEVRLVGALGNALPAGMPDRARLLTALTHGLTDWIAQHASVDLLAQKLASAVNGAGLAAVMNQLGAFGAQVQQRLGALAPDTGGLGTAIRGALDDYGRLRAKWIGALTDAAHAKLGATLGAQETRSAGDSALVDVVFKSGGGAPAGALYAALIRGHLDNLPARIAAAGATVVAGGTLTHDLGRASSLALSLQVLGNALSWTGSTAASLQVGTTLAGDVMAVAGEADADDAVRGFHANYQTSLACLYATQPRADGGLSGTVSFRGAYAWRGDGRTWADFDHVVASMAPLCALPTAGALAARLLPNGSPASHLSTAPMDLDVVLPMDLDAGEVARLANSPLDLGQLAAIALAIVDRIYPTLLPGGATLAAQVLGQAAPGPALVDYLARLAGTDGDSAQVDLVFPDAPSSGTLAGGLQTAARLAHFVARLCQSFVQLKASLATLLQVDPASLGNTPASRGRAIVQLAIMAHELEGAATYGVQDEIHMPWGVTAFAALLAASTGRPDQGAFAPVARITQDGRTTTLVLTAL